MDVRNGGVSSRLIWSAVFLHLVMGARALADPVYTAIDVGSGNPTYGVDSSGSGTITGSNGLTYVFNPVQSYLPAQWANTTQGVPIVDPAPIYDPNTYGNPKFAYSYSQLVSMNSQGLAVGYNDYGVSGHLGNAEVFLTQHQANGSWGTPTPLWSGSQDFAGPGAGTFGVGILGISPNGQVLGYGPLVSTGLAPSVLYLYHAKTQTLTNLTNVINSMTWTNPAQVPLGQSPDWFLSTPLSQLDNDGRLLVQATQGYSGPWHYMLLVPEGVSADPLAVPEPATWAVFATLIGGWIAHRRLRARPQPN
jgi:hypothetical protein